MQCGWYKEVRVLYESALAAYRVQDFAGTMNLFREVLVAKASDRPAQIMLERCRGFIESPPGSDWKAANAMEAK
jgi:adenylate cyclase